MYLITNITHKKDKKHADYNKTVNFSFKDKQLSTKFELKPNQSITVESSDIPIKIKELVFKGLLEMSIVPKQKPTIKKINDVVIVKKEAVKTVKKDVETVEIKDDDSKKYIKKSKKDDETIIYK